MDSDQQIKNEIIETIQSNQISNQVEIWKPVVKNGKIIPGYEISNFGRCKNKTGKLMKPINEIYEEKGNRQSISVVIPNDLFEDYNYFPSGPNTCKMRISVHRMVMETFKPIEEYPPYPMTKEEWSTTPESAKRILRDSCVVDHIDDNPFNNHVDNLRWLSSKDNSNFRKKNKSESTKKEEVC